MHQDLRARIPACAQCKEVLRGGGHRAKVCSLDSIPSLVLILFDYFPACGDAAGRRGSVMRPSKTASTGALALLLVALPSLADETMSEAIVVTATRFSDTDPSVPSNISVITRQDIRNSPARSVPELLGSNAGVFVSQLGGGALGRDATVDLRGFGSTATSNTLVLVDGLRVNPVDMGTIVWSSIPLENVERIEIVRGSGSVLYGDGASGGVVNIITNKSGKPAASVATTLGDYGYKAVDVRFANGNDQAYFNLQLNHTDANGYRDNGQQDQRTASGRVGWLLDRGEVFMDFATYKESQGLPGSVLSAAYRHDPRSTRFPHNTEARDGYRIRPGVAYQLTGALRLEAEIGIEHQSLESRYVASSFFSDRNRDTFSLTPRLRWQHGLGKLDSETVLGADFYDSDVQAKNVGSPDQSASQKSSAIYLQNITDLTDKLALTTGARTQRVRQSASQDAYPAWFQPAMDGSTKRSRSAYDLGLAWAEAGWRLYGKTGTTFRFANTDELFGADPVTYAPVFAGDIKPQRGRINEIGGSLAIGAANFRASLYQLDLKDEIGYDAAQFANINFDPTRRKGAELEVDWKIASSWRSKLAYAYTDATFRRGSYSGNDVPLVSRHQANVQLIWDAQQAGTYTASARYVGKRRYGSDFANAQGWLSGYTTLDLQGAWDLKPWRITAKVMNVLDKKYSPFAGYSTSVNDAYYYPADRRGVFISGRYDF